MDYTILTADHRQQMWRQTIAALEERHYALTMDRTMALAVTGDSGLPHPDVAARLTHLDAQIAAVEQQHARAVRELVPTAAMTTAS